MLVCLRCNSPDVEIVQASDYKDDIGHDCAVCPKCGALGLGEAMTNTTDKINQTIHEARGLCWHEGGLEIKSGITMPHCLNCGKNLPFSANNLNPDYTSDWSAWGAALEWAQWQEGFPKFLVEIIISYSPNTMDELLSASLNATLPLLNPLQGATALAEFIDKHPDIFKKEKGR